MYASSSRLSVHKLSDTCINSAGIPAHLSAPTEVYFSTDPPNSICLLSSYEKEAGIAEVAGVWNQVKANEFFQESLLGL